MCARAWVVHGAVTNYWGKQYPAGSPPVVPCTSNKAGPALVHSLFLSRNPTRTGPAWIGETSHSDSKANADAAPYMPVLSQTLIWTPLRQLAPTAAHAAPVCGDVGEDRVGFAVLHELEHRLVLRLELRLVVARLVRVGACFHNHGKRADNLTSLEL